MRKILKGEHKDSAASDDEQTSAYMDLPAESSWSRRYSSTLIAYVASFIRFPENAAQIESCRRTISYFGMTLDRILESSAVSRTVDPQTLDYTPKDLEAIQHAHDFASTCTSLFSQLVNGNKCGISHQAQLHLSGFKHDQLLMHIRTCDETGWISAVFTR